MSDDRFHPRTKRATASRPVVVQVSACRGTQHRLLSRATHGRNYALNTRCIHVWRCSGLANLGILQTCLFKLEAALWLGGQSPTSAVNWARSQASQSEICGGRNSNIGMGVSHFTSFSGQYYPTHARYSLIHSDVIVVRQTRVRVEHGASTAHRSCTGYGWEVINQLSTDIVLAIPSLWIPS
jgi:hypothetical protein